MNGTKFLKCVQQRLFRLVFLLMICTPTIFGQAIIGGGNSDNSAVLTVNGNIKGVLLPRLSTPQRNGIVSPPDGLMVYDLGTSSIWVYAANRWLQQYDSLQSIWRYDEGAGFTGSLFNSVGLRWGINSNNASSTLHLNSGSLITSMSFTNVFSGQNSNDGARVTMGNPADIAINNAEPGGITFENTAGPNLHISNTGQIGIGTKNTVAPLTFSGVNGEKINFYNSFSNASYGIGINNNSLQLHADLPASRVQFGYGRTSTGVVPRFTVSGNGQTQLQNKLLNSNSGTADLLPLAFGQFETLLGIITKSDNVTIVKAANGHYQVSVTGINFGVGNNFLIMASPFERNGNSTFNGYFDRAHTAEVSTNPLETFFTVKIVQTKVHSTFVTTCGCTATWSYQQTPQDIGVSFMVYRN